MKDRYLFRAKRMDNGEWVEGFLFQLCYDSIFCWCIGNEPLSPNDYSELYGFNREWFYIDESTICQCTGLMDKNGKLIWENDIIKCKEIITTVLWSTKHASYALTRKGWLYDHFFGESQNPEECEVIGNIFDEGSENIGKGAEEN